MDGQYYCIFSVLCYEIDYNQLFHAAMASKTTSVAHDSTALSFHIVGPTQQKGKGN